MKASAESVLRLLADRPEGLTRLEAIHAGCGNLPARVLEIKAAGHRVTDEWETTPNGARIKRWRLRPSPPVYRGSQEALPLA